MVLLLVTGAGCAKADAPTYPVSTATPAPTPSSTPSPEPAKPMNTTEKTWTYQGVLPANQITSKQARITTTYGDIVIELFDTTAPITVSNFVYLATGGFYDGLIFHRRESWVLQGGDPLGKGYGGPGYTIPDELKDSYGYERGIVAMANKGKPTTGGSQFFIMVKDMPLDKAYSVFGKVISGMDIVDKMKAGDTMERVVIESKK